MANEITEQYRTMVEKNGDSVGMDGPVCVLWKSDHGNCSGCDSELGCAKWTSLLLVGATAMVYKPKDYADFKAMNDGIQETMKAVLEAQSVDVLKAIR